MLKYQIRKYEKILLVEGIREAKNRGKNIQFGLEGRVVINEDIFENIYLAQNERGQTDISLILALGAEVNYEAGPGGIISTAGELEEDITFMVKCCKEWKDNYLFLLLKLGNPVANASKMLCDTPRLTVL